jgi:hypothetical protein
VTDRTYPDDGKRRLAAAEARIERDRADRERRNAPWKLLEERVLLRFHRPGGSSIVELLSRTLEAHDGVREGMVLRETYDSRARVIVREVRVGGLVARPLGEALIAYADRCAAREGSR